MIFLKPDRDQRIYLPDSSFKFRFTNHKDAMFFANKISDSLDNGQSLTIAELKKLYGIKVIDAVDEKKGWRGDIKITIDLFGDGYYYVIIHDDPIKLF